MNVIEYAIVREAQKVAQYPNYRPKGWERLIEIAWEIKKRDDAKPVNNRPQKTDGRNPVVSPDRSRA